VDEQGGIEGAVTIPASAQEGFHTLHLLGVNKVGDQVDLYQFLTIGESGNVVQSGASEGDMGHQGGISVSPTPKNGGATLDMVSNNADVLGVQTTKGTDSVVHKVLSTVTNSVTSYIKGIAWPIGWLLIELVVFVIATLLTICAVLFYKRWAKPGS
jgi:hypothetical protein